MDVVIMVSSCDQFASVQVPFCHGFRKYWPDCPWPLKFVTNFLDAPCGGTIRVGEDGGVYGWSAVSRRALEQERAPIVMWLHEDNWISRPVDTAAIISLVKLFEDRNLHLIRLSNCYASTTCGIYRKDGRLRVLCPNSRQRTSLQPSLWRRETFIRLLVDGESPWYFEGMGPLRSVHVDGDFLCCGLDFLPLRYMSHVDPDWDEEAVRRGCWTGAARRYARREGLDVDFSINPNGTRNG